MVSRKVTLMSLVGMLHQSTIRHPQQTSSCDSAIKPSYGWSPVKRPSVPPPFIQFSSKLAYLIVRRRNVYDM
jgi:hypothetical protein